MTRYHNKAPLSTLRPDPRHWTRKHNSWKQKIGYKSKDEAEEYIALHLRLKIQSAVSYLCPICNKWHVSVHYKKYIRRGWPFEGV